ncbi:sugar phosphate isomerase/epimerase [Sphingomonas sp. SUN039]|uniref:sugar phosphate isomerase/epimerase family protein n=1 Tax=Sphingomonas sp. SUN039 TaxID=2937787 RepID=UPI002164D634|nr:sugar phosphate isomerase/epimerase [Sphingomonas sp. SUN039]UVO55754.1 sugar phosphate isomerase/epimerase [Sphingomonas sp. SUN039]
MTNNRLGIEMLTLLGMPPVEHVRLAAELGCVSISTGLTNLPGSMIEGGALYPEWSLETDAVLVRELKAAMRDTGVGIGLGEGFRVRADGDVRDRAAGLDLMAELGAVRINAVSMEDDLARTYDQLGHLADMVIARGMVFTIEFAPPNAINTLAGALAAVEQVGQGRAAILFDAMHFFRSGATVAELKALDPALIGYAQLCDAPMRAPEGKTYMQEAMFERRVPGEGEFPLADWLAALPADVPISLEVPNLAALRGGSPRDHAARVVAAARALCV